MLTKKDRNISLIFILTCIIFIISSFFASMSIFNYKIDVLHKFFYVTAYIGILLIPIESIIGLNIWRKYSRNKTETKIINSILKLLSLVFFCGFVLSFIFFINSATLLGATQIYEVYEENQKYYVMIDVGIVEISKEQASIIDVSEAGMENHYIQKWYAYTYRYNKLIPDKGKIIYIKKLY